MNKLLRKMDPGGWTARAATGFACCLPFFPDAEPMFLLAIALSACWPGTKGHAVSWPEAASPSGWMLLLYAIHLAGLLWTVNFDFAGLDLGIKAPLAAFPLVYVFGRRLTQAHRLSVQRWFIGANVLAVILCVLWAVFRVARLRAGTGGENLDNYALSLPFFTSEFALFLHPSYMAMYLTFALVLLSRPAVRGAWPQGMAVPTMVVLALGVVLCASKAGWLLMLLFGAAMLVEYRNDGKLRRTATWSLAVALLTGLVLYNTTELVRERVQQVGAALRGNGQQSSEYNSTTDRLMVWQAAQELIAQHPWGGVGTGDVKDALMDQYGRMGFHDPLEKRLNAHSQYLNTGVALGLLGLLPLIAMLLVPLVLSIRRRDFLMAALVLITALNWAVESMLEVQAGVLFLAFFAWLLSAHGPDRRSTSSRP